MQNKKPQPDRLLKLEKHPRGQGEFADLSDVHWPCSQSKRWRHRRRSAMEVVICSSDLLFLSFFLPPPKIFILFFIDRLNHCLPKEGEKPAFESMLIFCLL